MSISLRNEQSPVIRRDLYFEDRLGEFIYKMMKNSPLHDFFLYCGNTLKKRMPESMWLEESSKLPNFWLYSTAFLFHLVFLLFVIVLGVQAYRSSIHDTFVSLSSDSGDCSTVPRSVSGQYAATINGYWSSQPGFSFNYSSYTVSLDNYARKCDYWCQYCVSDFLLFCRGCVDISKSAVRCGAKLEWLGDQRCTP